VDSPGFAGVRGRSVDLIATFGEGNSMVSRGIARVLVRQSSISALPFSFADNHLGFLAESL
jgi:hypothetical protein